MTERHVQPTDAEIEAIVADAIAHEAAVAASEAQPPSSAIVWWRSQMRARREAAQLAEKPITIVHALSIAAGVGLMLSVFGYVITAVKGSAGWLTNLAQSIATAASSPALSLASPWVTVTLTATLASVVVLSIAAYFIFADE